MLDYSQLFLYNLKQRLIIITIYLKLKNLRFFNFKFNYNLSFFFNDKLNLKLKKFFNKRILKNLKVKLFKIKKINAKILKRNKLNKLFLFANQMPKFSTRKKIKLSTKNLFVKGLYKRPEINLNLLNYIKFLCRRWRRDRYVFFTYARKLYKQHAWNRYLGKKYTSPKKLQFDLSKIKPLRFNFYEKDKNFFKRPQDTATEELWNDPILFPPNLLHKIFKTKKKKKKISNYIKLLKKRYKLRQFYYKNKFYNFKTWLGFYCGQIFRTTKFKQWLAYSRSNLAVYYPYRMFSFKSRRFKSITWRPYKLKPYVKKNSQWHKKQRRLHFKRVRLFRQACWVPAEKAAPLQVTIFPKITKTVPFFFFKPGPRVFAWFYLIDSFFFWIIYFFHLFFLLYLKTLMMFD